MTHPVEGTTVMPLTFIIVANSPVNFNERLRESSASFAVFYLRQPLSGSGFLGNARNYTGIDRTLPKSVWPKKLKRLASRT